MQAAFDELRRRADAGEIQAVAVTGKPFIFAVGFDLSGAAQHDTSASRARRWPASATTPTRCSWTFRCRPSRSSTARSWAAAWSSRSRATTAPSPPACPRSPCPECFLGLVPVWGGCWMLPNLVGVRNALTVIVENPLSINRMLKGPAAFELGLADVHVRAGRLPRGVHRLGRDGGHRRDEGDRPEVDRDEAAWEGAIAAARKAVRRRAPVVGAGAATAPSSWSGGPHRHPRRGLRRRGRGGGRPAHARRDRGRALRLRPGAEAGQAPGRRAGQDAGPTGHQGRHRRRRPDGQPARAAVRPAPAGAGRADRPGPGAWSTRAWATSTAELDGWPEGPAQRRQGSTATRPWSPARRARTASPTRTSSSRRSSRRWRSRSRSSPRSRPSCGPSASWRRNTSWPVDHRDGRRPAAPRAGRRVPLLQPGRGHAAAGDHPRRAHRRGHAGHGVRHRPDAGQDRASSPEMPRRSSPTGCSAGSCPRSFRIVDEGTPVEVADRAFAGLAPMPPFVLLGLVGPAIALHNTETLHGRLPGPLLRLREPAPGRRGRQERLLRLARGQAVDPEVTALLATPDEPVVLTARRCASGSSAAWRRRSG